MKILGKSFVLSVFIKVFGEKLIHSPTPPQTPRVASGQIISGAAYVLNIPFRVIHYTFFVNLQLFLTPSLSCLLIFVLIHPFPRQWSFLTLAPPPLQLKIV